MCAYRDQFHRCQALNRVGSQCRNRGTVYVALDAQSEALMCPEHQRLAREGRVQVVGHQRSYPDMIREAMLRDPKTPERVRERMRNGTDAEVLEFVRVADAIANLTPAEREELAQRMQRMEQEGVA